MHLSLPLPMFKLVLVEEKPIAKMRKKRGPEKHLPSR
jgi:hypothetical protein